ncbi:hypothetical protein TWF718_000348 [Orbilia javanica]|uniref:F-box domain-containing protein n=1 Tax=Orbilia javanica TaxID=47235 RepID=A0AAN8MX11_9PEZI
MFFCSREKDSAQLFFDMLFQKIVCTDMKEALLWPQVLTDPNHSKDIAPVRRRVIMEVVQYLLRPEDSSIVVGNINVKPKDDIQNLSLASLPVEIFLIILEHLDNFSALSLALTSRAFYNASLDRVQNILCPLAELGRWAGKPLVRAGIVVDLEEGFSSGRTEIDEAGGTYLMNVLESKMIGLRERGYYTIYDSDDPGKLAILRSVAADNHIPPVIRRYASAILGNTEYENMFQEGREYIIRNLDKMEYVPFPTGRLERTITRPRGVYDDTLVKTPHVAERVIDAITWSPTMKAGACGLEKGAWVGNRIDIVLDNEGVRDGWKKL